MLHAGSQRLLLTFLSHLASSVEQDLPEMQNGGCSVLPVSTEICGDRNGEPDPDLKRVALLTLLRNSSMCAAGAVTSSHDTLVLAIIALGSFLCYGVQRIWI